MPGPTPDPSKIPSVVREVGQLDIEGKIEELGIAKISNPIISELIEFFEETPKEFENTTLGRISARFCFFRRNRTDYRGKNEQRRE